MAEPTDLEARVAALETTVKELRKDTSAARGDAAAARHLSAANDRDVAELSTKVDALRKAVNGLGEQTRERFERLEDKVDSGFAEMRGKIDGTAAGIDVVRQLLERREDG